MASEESKPNGGRPLEPRRSRSDVQPQATEGPEFQSHPLTKGGVRHLHPEPFAVYLIERRAIQLRRGRWDPKFLKDDLKRQTDMVVDPLGGYMRPEVTDEFEPDTILRRLKQAVMRLVRRTKRS